MSDAPPVEAPPPWTLRPGRVSAVHLAAYAAVAAYLVVFHPAGMPIVIALWLCGTAAELAPQTWKRHFFCEAVLVAAVLVTLAVAWPLSEAALHPAIGIVLAWWCLVPSRPGFLFFLAVMCVVEAVAVGGLPPVAGRLTAAAAVPWLALIAVGALAGSAWLEALRGARGRVRARFGWLRRAALPAGAAALLGLALLPLGQPAPPARAAPARGTMPVPGVAAAGIAGVMRIGDHDGLRRDPQVVARLSWDEDADRGIPGMVYLRAAALSTLVLDRSEVLWKPHDTGAEALRQAELPLIPGEPVVGVLRLASADHSVLLPDGETGTSLDDLWRDAEGNVVKEGFGAQPRSYRATLPVAPLRVVPGQDAPARALPAALRDDPTWAALDEPGWRAIDGPAAATAVAAALRARGCTYAIDHLPPPAPGPAGSLKTFLTGAPGDRRGHCQYFAGAAAVLLRRAGHAARCVVGYASDEFDGRSVVFRALHAHAWIEVADRDGRWQRVDPTPASMLRERAPAGDTPPPPAPPVPSEAMQRTPQEIAAARVAAVRRHAPWALVALIAVAILVLFIVRQLRRRGRDPRAEHLRRQADGLFQLAAELGIAVAPATTLGHLADQLSRRAGIDLAALRDAHQAARFGGGPLPPPFPIADLRRALRAKVSTRRMPVAGG